MNLKVVEVKPQENGTFVNKLNFRTDTVIKDEILGEVVKTQSEYYYVKTKKALNLNAEVELEMSNYDVEESEFKNTDENSAYYGDMMTSKWLTPKEVD